MKKISIAVMMVAGLFSAARLSAQSVPEGINHLYADRDQSAKAVFEKLVAANPNNLDAVYWLGQTFIEMQDVESARQLYDKTLAANGNAPLILVGRGHIDLFDNKANEARQRFEAALTASRGKKGDDPNILNAIGRATIVNKLKEEAAGANGIINYGIEKLKAGTERDPKNADILLNLGDAYRKIHDGSNAVMNYQKALTVNPGLARAEYRKAMIYYTQKNWDVYLENLNKAITIDPKFAPAYYELYYYNLYRQKFAEADDFAKKYIANSDADVQTDYLIAQTAWAKKDYDAAINTLKNIVAKAGDKTNPKTYKLLAYSHVDKGDTTGAKQYIDTFFAKANDEDIIPADYILQGQIYGVVTKDDAIVMQSFEKAVALDTIYRNKIDLLNDAIEKAKAKNNKEMQGALGLLLFQTKKEPTHTDLFNPALSYYQAGSYQKSDSIFNLYNSKYPDSIYGYFWGARANIALDTTLSVEPYLTNMITGFKKSLEIAGQPNNKERFKTQAVQSSQFLAGIYNNTKKNKDSAIYFVQKGLEFDPGNANLTRFLEILQKPARSNSRPSSGSGGGGSKPSSMKPEANTSRSSVAARR